LIGATVKRLEKRRARRLTAPMLYGSMCAYINADQQPTDFLEKA